MAWQCSSSEVIVKGFKKCCITNAIEKSDGGMLWNDSEEDGNVSTECEEEEGADCEERE